MTVECTTWSSAPNSSGSAFNTWVQGVHDALEAIGMVQTTDTGQIDISTADTSSTSGNNQVVGYEIWRFDDDVQSTAPIFFKLEYGVSYSAGTYKGPQMWLTVGRGSNGSGSITGPLFLSRKRLTDGTGQVYQGTTSGAINYASSDGSVLNLILWPDTYAGSYGQPSGLGGFTIERSCGSDGTYTGDAVAVALYTSYNNWLNSVTAYDGEYAVSKSAEWQRGPIKFPTYINGVSTEFTLANLSEDGSKAPAFPLPLAAPGVSPWISCGLVGIYPGDTGITGICTVAINGEDRHYKPLAVNPAANGGVGLFGYGPYNGNRMTFPAILWE